MYHVFKQVVLFSSFCIDGIDILLLTQECIQLLLSSVDTGLWVCHCVCMRVCVHNVEGLCEPHGFPYCVYL